LTCSWLNGCSPKENTSWCACGDRRGITKGPEGTIGESFGVSAVTIPVTIADVARIICVSVQQGAMQVDRLRFEIAGGIVKLPTSARVVDESAA